MVSESVVTVRLASFHYAKQNGEVAVIISVAHGCSILTFHSLHDGKILRTLNINATDLQRTSATLITDMWWIKHDITSRTEAFKNLLDRKEIVSSERAR